MDTNQDFSSRLSRYAKDMGIELNDNQIKLCRDYSEELAIWNRRINLVSSGSPSDLLIKHFVDSLSALRFIEKKDARIIDIGSGAGFPGIPLKIALPSLSVSLLEVSRKRVSFLKNVIRKLTLMDVEVINRRVQDVIKSGFHRGVYDAVISRAAFKLPELAGMAGYFLGKNGIMLAMKGFDIDFEISEAEKTAESSRLTHVSCHEMILPLTGSLRKIVIYRKR